MEKLSSCCYYNYLCVKLSRTFTKRLSNFTTRKRYEALVGGRGMQVEGHSHLRSYFLMSRFDSGRKSPTSVSGDITGYAGRPRLPGSTEEMETNVIMLTQVKSRGLEKIQNCNSRKSSTNMSKVFACSNLFCEMLSILTWIFHNLNFVLRPSLHNINIPIV